MYIKTLTSVTVFPLIQIQDYQNIWVAMGKSKSKIKKYLRKVSNTKVWPFLPNVAFHIETSHLISTTNHNNGFYMKYKTGLKCVRLYDQLKWKWKWQW